MTTVLQEILCVLQKLGATVVNGVVAIVNQVITGLAIMGAAATSLLPDMPEPPAEPGNGVLGWINFFVPLAPLAGVLVTMGGLFAGFLLARVALNWIRAL